MRKTIAALMLTMGLTASANHPDSVYIKPDVRNGSSAFQISYSIDGKHWKHLNHTLFSSDYGPWGRQKKMYYPVISYDGRQYSATFIPDTTVNQIAVTKTETLALWKPQDYPVLSVSEFAKRLLSQKKAAADNVIRIPYTDFQALLDRKALAERNYAFERENYVQTGTYLANSTDSVTVKMTVDWTDTKPISSNLMGVFFEDISYAADGGLYGELVQNRDFEYSKRDHDGWNAMTAWRIDGNGMTGKVESVQPMHKNNPHYIVLSTASVGGKLINEGWDGIAVRKGEKYLFSSLVRGKGKFKVSIMANGNMLATTVLKSDDDWKNVKAEMVSSQTANDAVLIIEPLQTGEIAFDMVSLFPKDTYKGRVNGMRRDLAEAIADLKPRFVRFPGGCATHGNGIDNIYHWQSSIGELWERQGDFNIWHYHQTRGLGFYEYFQFCEDIGAEPLPVLAAGVPCQNSSHGGNGQQGGIPFERELGGKPSPYTYNGKPLTMESYLQELLDLVEWANGDAKTSKLAAMRAKAGHTKPFNMKYLGIGNEDLLGDVFMERYRFLIEGVKKAHPEITIVGTVGPFWEGSDYEYGWKEAKEKNIEIVDEHYYNTPGWYFHHRDFYDKYDRNGTKVYLGEWASKGNNVSNALVEAAYLTNVERNADVVVMSSYAPLLAKQKYTSWNPDLIYFNNTEVLPTANYYVQRAFGQNNGDTYVYSDVEVDYKSTDVKKPHKAALAERIDKSVVVDSKTGDVIVKVVSMLPSSVRLSMEKPVGYSNTMTLTQLSAPVLPDRSKEWSSNSVTTIKTGDMVELEVPAYSLTVMRFTRN